MKTCPKCNLSYSDDKHFCKECGDSLIYIDPKHEKESVKIIKKVIGVVLVIIGLIFILSSIISFFQLLFKSENFNDPLSMSMPTGVVIIILIIRILIGIGFLAGGYFLFKRKSYSRKTN